MMGGIEMIKQCVVRTAPEDRGIWYDKKRMQYLEEKLNQGWTVIMCNPIGNNLEYILQKEVKDDEWYIAYMYWNSTK